MPKWTLEWHSIRTGKEGLDYEEANTIEEAKRIYKQKYPMREVKAVVGFVNHTHGLNIGDR